MTQTTIQLRNVFFSKYSTTTNLGETTIKLFINCDQKNPQRVSYLLTFEDFFDRLKNDPNLYPTSGTFANKRKKKDLFYSLEKDNGKMVFSTLSLKFVYFLAQYSNIFHNISHLKSLENSNISIFICVYLCYLRSSIFKTGY